MASKKRTTGLKDRLKKSYQDKDKGSGGQSAFDWKLVDGEVKFYKLKEGKHRINIIPYEIKTKNHPLVKSGDMEIGQLDYLMDIWQHRSVGPAQADVICPKRNFGKPCPICEQGDKFKQDGKEKEYNSLKPKRMVYYNVQDVRDPDKGLQVLGVSHYLFERELIDEARADSDNGDILDFPDIDDGCVVVFRAATANFGGHDYFEFKSFQFVDREEALDESLIDEAISFDEIMKVLSYKEIEDILFGLDDEEDEDEDDDEEDEEPAPKKRKKKPQMYEEDEDEEADEADEEEEADDDPPPKKKSRKKPEPEEDEDGDEDEEEEKPAPKKKSPAKKKSESDEDNPCPSGYMFGKDCDTKEECDECPKWGACLKEKNRLKK